MPTTKTERCTCKHYQGQHREAKGKTPAYCSVCKGGKALHKYERTTA